MVNAEHDGLPAYLVPFAKYLVVDSPALKITRRVVGAAAILGCIALSIAFLIVRDNARTGNPAIPAYAIILISWAVIIANYVLFLFAKAMFARSAIPLLTRQSVHPILFLRSFSTDVRIGSGPEYRLERALRPLGPLVAVGLPKEKVPPVGAARLYLTDDNWQEVVKCLMHEAKVIVLRIGRTEGFWWEVRECVRRGEPEKLLFFLPPRDARSAYEQFRDDARGVLPVELPPLEGGALFLAFTNEWVPYFLKAERRSIRLRRGLLRAPLEVALRDALRTRYPVPGMKMTLDEWANIILVVSLAGSLLSIVHEWARQRALLDAAGRNVRE